MKQNNFWSKKLTIPQIILTTILCGGLLGLPVAFLRHENNPSNNTEIQISTQEPKSQKVYVVDEYGSVRPLCNTRNFDLLRAKITCVDGGIYYMNTEDRFYVEDSDSKDGE